MLDDVAVASRESTFDAEYEMNAAGINAAIGLWHDEHHVGEGGEGDRSFQDFKCQEMTVRPRKKPSCSNYNAECHSGGVAKFHGKHGIRGYGRAKVNFHRNGYTA